MKALALVLTATLNIQAALGCLISTANRVSTSEHCYTALTTSSSSATLVPPIMTTTGAPTSAILAVALVSATPIIVFLTDRFISSDATASVNDLKEVYDQNALAYIRTGIGHDNTFRQSLLLDKSEEKAFSRKMRASKQVQNALKRYTQDQTDNGLIMLNNSLIGLIHQKENKGLKLTQLAQLNYIEDYL